MSQRARDAFEVRLKAALFQMRRGTSLHRSNGDERRYENRIGSFSKFLPHDANGEVDRVVVRLTSAFQPRRLMMAAAPAVGQDA